MAVPPSSLRQRIGIFGGSFNPLHCGHIRLARQLLQLAALDEIWFVVSPLNPLKEAATDLLADDLRLLMTRQALAREPRLRASDYEFRLPKPSYMWNTLAHLQAEWPGREFVLVIGADNWLAFDRWARADYILAHYEVAVYPRPGYPVDRAALPPGVHLLDTDLYHVSSTDIRRRVQAGLSVEGLVPESIRMLVEQYYRTDE